MTHFPQHQSDEAAIKGDMSALKSDIAMIRSDMADFKGELRADIKEIRTDIKDLRDIVRDQQKFLCGNRRRFHDRVDCDLFPGRGDAPLTSHSAPD